MTTTCQCSLEADTAVQARSEQLAEEQAELTALKHELKQRERELSRQATEQATAAANTQVPAQLALHTHTALFSCAHALVQIASIVLFTGKTAQVDSRSCIYSNHMPGFSNHASSC